MSIILNIDSSLQTAVVSIAKEGKIISVLKNDVQKEHASFIHTAIQQLVKTTGLSLQQMDAIAVTTGPGSYTGLRVGLAAAKGLAYALHKPLITTGTLEVMAKQAINTQANPTDFYYCAMIDARRMEVFTAIYSYSLTEVLAPCAIVLNSNSFDLFLNEKPILFFGSGAEKWMTISNNKNVHTLQISDNSVMHALLSQQQYITQSFAHIVSSAPLYVKDFFDGR